MAVAFNHVGQCVTDLDRSRRFYRDVLGFEPWYEIHPDDELSSKLLRLEPPLGMTAVYLRRDGLVLELLHFAGAPPAPRRDRVMNEPGLTHVSVSVDDVDATLRLVTEHGGEVLEDTNIGFGLFVRDPDGQLVEILPMAFRESLPD
jgi:catechol 2,3-dioxygenase-like lactoylglutathione lyase family enzyme